MFSCCCVVGVPYILDTNLLSDALFAGAFSHLTDCLSPLLTVSLAAHSLFLTRIRLFILLVAVLLGSHPEHVGAAGREAGDLSGVTRGLWGPTWQGTLTPSGDPGSPHKPAGLSGLRWCGEMCPGAGRRSWEWPSWGPSPPLPVSLPVESHPQPGWAWLWSSLPWAGPAPSVAQMGDTPGEASASSRTPTASSPADRAHWFPKL